MRWDGYGLGIRTPPADPRPNIRRRPRVGWVVRSAGLMLGRGVDIVDWVPTRVKVGGKKIKIDIIASNIGGVDESNTQGRKPGGWAKACVSSGSALLLLGGTQAIVYLPVFVEFTFFTERGEEFLNKTIYSFMGSESGV